MSYPDWLLWLGGTLLPLGLLWALWRLVLRPERCYGYNRALLLLAPVVAAAWPLLPRPALPAWLAAGAAKAAPVAAVILPTLPTGSTAPRVAAVLASWPWLLALYLAGVALGLAWLASQTWRLHQLAQQLPRLAGDGYTLVRTGGLLPTSTFGRVVFWDETLALAPAEVTAVLAHELAHVRQRHTLAVLWLQLWRVVLWPNPFAHLLLPALRLTHELLADRAASSATPAAGLPAQPYGSLLARLAARQLARPAYSLLQPFAFSSTLTRIAMLQRHPPVRRWKQWLVLPVLGSVFLAVSQLAAAAPSAVPSEVARLAFSWRQVQANSAAYAGHTGSWFALGTGPAMASNELPGSGEAGTASIRRRDELPGAPAQAAPPSKVYTYVEQMPQLPGGGGNLAIVQAIQAKVVYPNLKRKPRGGMVYAYFVVGPDGHVRDPRIVQSPGPDFSAAVLAAVQQLPVFVPGRQGGKPVSVSFTVPLQFVLKP